jgi:hypothetical protein
MDILDAETREWTSLALFSDALPEDEIIGMALTLWLDVSGADDLAIINIETGEVVWNAANREDDDPDWGYNEDMGFDPYLGCYTDDC